MGTGDQLPVHGGEWHGLDLNHYMHGGCEVVRWAFERLGGPLGDCAEYRP